MKWVRDTLDLYTKRPHFAPEELDQICESRLEVLMSEVYGTSFVPIPTDILTKLIELEADSLDLYADFSDEEDEVQGATYFQDGKKPRVRIARELSEQPARSNRLRTTLAHEYGHVCLHGPLWDYRTAASQQGWKCQRKGLLGPAGYDWREWQAGYVCGALLMPGSWVKRVIVEFAVGGYSVPAEVESPEGELMATFMTERFRVSRAAAIVRLSKMGYLLDGKPRA